jgi:ERCC4-related helicase
VRIVVSTHQILLDALSNGFVDMGTLSLLIFDEAHNCVKSHPGSRIMKDIYQYRKAQGFSVPNILGLSASPIMNSKLDSLGNIETTLNAICKTPVRTQAELLQHVKIPELCQVLYVKAELDGYTRSLASLQNVFYNLDIYMDPYVRRLRLEKTLRSEEQLAKTLRKQNTYCFKQMKRFCNTSLVIFSELGAWAVDCYIAQVVTKFRQFVVTNNDYLDGWRDEEKRYLSEILGKVEISPQAIGNLLVSPPVSDKVKQLISALPQDGVSTMIVFVERRVTVAILACLLSVHPLTSKLRVGTVVGTSVNERCKVDISELISLKDQRHTLTKFRAKELDLVVATSVLEEGIDIPSCNTVICFDEPPNLKSFVQRRGRARKSESKLILMQNSQLDKLGQWQRLEAEMKRIYADDMRELEKEEGLEEHDGREFRVESTG